MKLHQRIVSRETRICYVLRPAAYPLNVPRETKRVIKRSVRLPKMGGKVKAMKEQTLIERAPSKMMSWHKPRIARKGFLL